VADIGVFEHSLTTDLLNHLVFVQKVFMKVSSVVCRCVLLIVAYCGKIVLHSVEGVN
jgi:hypothetical protein